MISPRDHQRRLAHQFQEQGNPSGWFEALYAGAKGDPGVISWADMKPNPHLIEWLARNQIQGDGKKALVVGCGLGDDAEALAQVGFQVTAFDIAPTAIAWCRQRFPRSPVDYRAVDLFQAPAAWDRAFNFVLESYTLQVLPLDLRPTAMLAIAGFVVPDGTLLLLCRGRDAQDDPGSLPWPLTHEELRAFEQYGLHEISFEDFQERDDTQVRRFRVQYQK